MDKQTIAKIKDKHKSEDILREIVKAHGLGDVITMLVDMARCRKDDDLDWASDFALLRFIQGNIKN